MNDLQFCLSMASGPILITGATTNHSLLRRLGHLLSIFWDLAIVTNLWLTFPMNIHPKME